MRLPADIPSPSCTAVRWCSVAVRHDVCVMVRRYGRGFGGDVLVNHFGGVRETRGDGAESEAHRRKRPRHGRRASG